MPGGSRSHTGKAATPVRVGAWEEGGGKGARGRWRVCVCVCVRRSLKTSERSTGRVPMAMDKSHQPRGGKKTTERVVCSAPKSSMHCGGRAEVHQCWDVQRCISAGACRGGGYGGGAGSAAEAEAADLQPPLGGSLGHSLHCGQVGRVVLL